MIKKIGVVTAMAGTFLLSSAFQSPVHAQSCNQQQDQYNHAMNSADLNHFSHSRHIYINRNDRHFYWIKINQPTANQPKQKQSNAGQTTATQSKQTQSNNGPKPQTHQSQSNSGQTAATQSNSEKPQSNQKGTYQLSQFEQQVVQLTNKQRTSHGLKPLKIDPTLSKMARDKSQDMANNHYFSHTSPTYGSPFNMMKQYGISYSYAGENIAEGQQTPQEVVNAWMNSPEHRANILNPHYTQIGVGYAANGNIWTQDFIG